MDIKEIARLIVEKSNHNWDIDDYLVELKQEIDTLTCRNYNRKGNCYESDFEAAKKRLGR